MRLTRTAGRVLLLGILLMAGATLADKRGGKGIVVRRDKTVTLLMPGKKDLDWRGFLEKVDGTESFVYQLQPGKEYELRLRATHPLYPHVGKKTGSFVASEDIDGQDLNILIERKLVRFEP